MGKVEEEQPLSVTVTAEILEENVENRCRINKFLGVRCVVVLLFSATVLLSAIFWLPPFLRYGDSEELNPGSNFDAYDIVASFEVERPISVLRANVLQLEYDIFGELNIPNSSVVVISLKPLTLTKVTSVMFAVVADPNYSRISSAALSLLRASFVYLVTRQLSLHLSWSLFGEAFLFEIIKFPGGITVIPQQSAFPLQEVQILFIFNLNSTIYQIQKNFNELKNQLKSGLRLSPYENLYVRLTNLQGSTVAPPTTVQASVLLAIGNRPPSLPRLKQLAQTITGSPARNLGLNHTVFGRVKQVRLSSDVQYSIHGGGSSGTSGSPSPAPLFRSHNHHQHHHYHHHHHIHHHHHHHHHHHNHHHHHHRQYNDSHYAPAISPEPEENHKAKPPSSCGIQFARSVKRKPHLVPTFAPMISPLHSVASPHLHIGQAAPASHLIPASSPFPVVILTHVQPPTERTGVEPPDLTPPVSPLPSSFSAGLALIQWTICMFVPLVLHLFVN